MSGVHDKLKRVRKPRVHITYEVETGGSEVERELPFVMGVLGDFSGNPSKPMKPLKDRKFIQIDRDNFDQVLTKIAPEINAKVENTIAGDGSEMAVSLKFRRMEDFEPGAIIEQVEPLKKLLETRNRLNDLMSKVDRSEDLEAILEDVLQNTEKMDALKGELGLDGASSAPEPEAASPADDSADAGDGGDDGDKPSEEA